MEDKAKPKFIIITTVPISLNFFRGQISYLKKKFDIEVISSPGDELKDICIDENIIGHALEMQRDISIIKDIRSLLKLVWLFLSIRPQIIHGSTPKAGLLSITAAWITRIPVRIYYVHGLRYQGDTGLKNRILKFMETIVCFFATDIIAVSKGVKSQMYLDNVTNKNIDIIGNGSVNGIDFQYYSENSILPTLPPVILNRFNENDFVFGFVGRIVKDKGIVEMVTAFTAINDKFPNTKLLIIGEFEEDLDPIPLATKQEILNNNHIIHTGFQKDVRPFYKKMDVVVLPSYREGFGMVLLEAAAMGTPAIAANIIGCNEIIENNINGILIEPKSASQLYSAMEKMFIDDIFLKKISLSSRNYVANKYSQQKVWENTLLTYTSLLDHSNS